jgi:Phage replication protein CRI
MLFIDRLDVSQDHGIDLDWGPTVVLEIDRLTGEQRWRTIKGDSVEGSARTSVWVRCSLGCVWVSGNPSKWGRYEALLGISDMSSCLAVYNEILRGLGLPEFVDRGKVVLKGGDHVRSCPRASRIDVTRNLILGSHEAAAAFAGWMGSQRWGRRGLPFVQGKGLTLKAGHESRRVMTFYDKGSELLAAAGKWARSRSDEREEAISYLRALSDWATQHGVMRQELRLGSKVLSETGWCWLDDRYQEAGVLAKLWTDYGGEIQAMGAEIGVVLDWKGQAVRRLVDQAGVSERVANEIVRWLLGWMGGLDPRSGISTATFYRRASLVRCHLGVDVRGEPNIVSLASRSRALACPVSARVLELSDLPEWYRAAA